MSEIGGRRSPDSAKVADLDPSSQEMANGAELLIEQLSELTRDVVDAAEGLDRDEERLERSKPVSPPSGT